MVGAGGQLAGLSARGAVADMLLWAIARVQTRVFASASYRKCVSLFLPVSSLSLQAGVQQLSRAVHMLHGRLWASFGLPPLAQGYGGGLGGGSGRRCSSGGADGGAPQGTGAGSPGGLAAAAHAGAARAPAEGDLGATQVFGWAQVVLHAKLPNEVAQSLIRLHHPPCRLASQGGRAVSTMSTQCCWTSLQVGPRCHFVQLPCCHNSAAIYECLEYSQPTALSAHQQQRWRMTCQWS